MSIMTGRASRVSSYHITKSLAGNSPVAYLRDNRICTSPMLYSTQKSQIGINGLTDFLKEKSG